MEVSFINFYKFLKLQEVEMIFSLQKAEKKKKTRYKLQLLTEVGIKFCKQN